MLMYTSVLFKRRFCKVRYCAEDVYQGGPVLCLEKVSVKFGLWVQIGKFATSEILN